jgi:hypothetical protein
MAERQQRTSAPNQSAGAPPENPVERTPATPSRPGNLIFSADGLVIGLANGLLFGTGTEQRQPGSAVDPAQAGHEASGRGDGKQNIKLGR